jgi:hypothetical protein
LATGANVRAEADGRTLATPILAAGHILISAIGMPAAPGVSPALALAL